MIINVKSVQNIVSKLLASLVKLEWPKWMMNYVGASQLIDAHSSQSDRRLGERRDDFISYNETLCVATFSLYYFFGAATAWIVFLATHILLHYYNGVFLADKRRLMVFDDKGLAKKPVLNRNGDVVAHYSTYAEFVGLKLNIEFFKSERNKETMTWKPLPSTPIESNETQTKHQAQQNEINKYRGHVFNNTITDSEIYKINGAKCRWLFFIFFGRLELFFKFSEIFVNIIFRNDGKLFHYEPLTIDNKTKITFVQKILFLYVEALRYIWAWCMMLFRLPFIIMFTAMDQLATLLHYFHFYKVSHTLGSRSMDIILLVTFAISAFQTIVLGGSAAVAELMAILTLYALEYNKVISKKLIDILRTSRVVAVTCFAWLINAFSYARLSLWSKIYYFLTGISEIVKSLLSQIKVSVTHQLKKVLAKQRNTAINSVVTDMEIAADRNIKESNEDWAKLLEYAATMRNGNNISLESVMTTHAEAVVKFCESLCKLPISELVIRHGASDFIKTVDEHLHIHSKRLEEVRNGYVSQQSTESALLVEWSNYVNHYLDLKTILTAFDTFYDNQLKQPSGQDLLKQLILKIEPNQSFYLANLGKMAMNPGFFSSLKKESSSSGEKYTPSQSNVTDCLTKLCLESRVSIHGKSMVCTILKEMVRIGRDNDIASNLLEHLGKVEASGDDQLISKTITNIIKQAVSQCHSSSLENIDEFFEWIEKLTQQLEARIEELENQDSPEDQSILKADTESYFDRTAVLLAEFLILSNKCETGLSQLISGCILNLSIIHRNLKAGIIGEASLAVEISDSFKMLQRQMMEENQVRLKMITNGELAIIKNDFDKLFGVNRNTDQNVREKIQLVSLMFSPYETLYINARLAASLPMAQRCSPTLALVHYFISNPGQPKSDSENTPSKRVIGDPLKSSILDLMLAKELINFMCFTQASAAPDCPHTNSALNRLLAPGFGMNSNENMSAIERIYTRGAYASLLSSYFAQYCYNSPLFIHLITSQAKQSIEKGDCDYYSEQGLVNPVSALDTPGETVMGQSNLLRATYNGQEECVTYRSFKQQWLNKTGLSVVSEEQREHIEFDLSMKVINLRQSQLALVAAFTCCQELMAETTESESQETELSLSGYDQWDITEGQILDFLNDIPSSYFEAEPGSEYDPIEKIRSTYLKSSDGSGQSKQCQFERERKFNSLNHLEKDFSLVNLTDKDMTQWGVVITTLKELSITDSDQQLLNDDKNKMEEAKLLVKQFENQDQSDEAVQDGLAKARQNYNRASFAYHENYNEVYASLSQYLAHWKPGNSVSDALITANKQEKDKYLESMCKKHKDSISRINEIQQTTLIIDRIMKKAKLTEQQAKEQKLVRLECRMRAIHHDWIKSPLGDEVNQDWGGNNSPVRYPKLLQNKMGIYGSINFLHNWSLGSIDWSCEKRFTEWKYYTCKCPQKLYHALILSREMALYDQMGAIKRLPENTTGEHYENYESFKFNKTRENQLQNDPGHKKELGSTPKKDLNKTGNNQDKKEANSELRVAYLRLLMGVTDFYLMLKLVWGLVQFIFIEAIAALVEFMIVAPGFLIIKIISDKNFYMDFKADCISFIKSACFSEAREKLDTSNQWFNREKLEQSDEQKEVLKKLNQLRNLSKKTIISLLSAFVTRAAEQIDNIVYMQKDSLKMSLEQAKQDGLYVLIWPMLKTLCYCLYSMVRNLTLLVLYGLKQLFNLLDALLFSAITMPFFLVFRLSHRLCYTVNDYDGLLKSTLFNAYCNQPVKQSIKLILGLPSSLYQQALSLIDKLKQFNNFGSIKHAKSFLQSLCWPLTLIFIGLSKAQELVDQSILMLLVEFGFNIKPNQSPSTQAMISISQSILGGGWKFLCFSVNIVILPIKRVWFGMDALLVYVISKLGYQVNQSSASLTEWLAIKLDQCLGCLVKACWSCMRKIAYINEVISWSMLEEATSFLTLVYWMLGEDFVIACLNWPLDQAAYIFQTLVMTGINLISVILNQCLELIQNSPCQRLLVWLNDCSIAMIGWISGISYHNERLRLSQKPRSIIASLVDMVFETFKKSTSMLVELCMMLAHIGLCLFYPLLVLLRIVLLSFEVNLPIGTTVVLLKNKDKAKVIAYDSQSKLYTLRPLCGVLPDVRCLREGFYEDKEEKYDIKSSLSLRALLRVDLHLWSVIRGMNNSFQFILSNLRGYIAQNSLKDGFVKPMLYDFPLFILDETLAFGYGLCMLSAQLFFKSMDIAVCWLDPLISLGQADDFYQILAANERVKKKVSYRNLIMNLPDKFKSNGLFTTMVHGLCYMLFCPTQIIINLCLAPWRFIKLCLTKLDYVLTTALMINGKKKKTETNKCEHANNDSSINNQGNQDWPSDKEHRISHHAILLATRCYDGGIKPIIACCLLISYPVIWFLQWLWNGLGSLFYQQLQSVMLSSDRQLGVLAAALIKPLPSYQRGWQSKKTNRTTDAGCESKSSPKI